MSDVDLVRRFSLLLAPLVASTAARHRPAAPFKIGVLGPLTGGAAIIGSDEVNGIKLRPGP